MVLTRKATSRCCEKESLEKWYCLKSTNRSWGDACYGTNRFKLLKFSWRGRRCSQILSVIRPEKSYTESGTKSEQEMTLYHYKNLSMRLKRSLCVTLYLTKKHICFTKMFGSEISRVSQVVGVKPERNI